MASHAPTIEVPLPPKELQREPLVLNQRPLGWISNQIAVIAEGKAPRWWWLAFIPSFLTMCVGASMLADRKSTRLNSSHIQKSRMPSSA